MNTNPDQSNPENAERALRAAAAFWFIVAVIGQWIFVYYIAFHYGGAGLYGDYEAWGKSSIKGHVSGDTFGNLIFGAHVLMAAIITIGGTLQLVPQIRSRAISFHRWNGRLFILTAFAISLGGLYLVWIRGATMTLLGAYSITLNAILIIVFAALAWRNAMAGDFVTHRRWALRAFLMVNGVWFFRVGFMGWIVINQGPLWSTDNLDGPFDIVWGFANYLLPLAVLEVYLRIHERGGTLSKYVMASGLFLLTILMGVGIFGAFKILWQPYF